MSMEYYDGYSPSFKNFIDCSNVSYSLPSISSQNVSENFICPERIDEMSFNKTANSIKEIFTSFYIGITENCRDDGSPIECDEATK